MLARDQWRARAERLGLLDDAERDATIRLGPTGGEPPRTEG